MKISFVTAARNSGRSIGLCLDSIAAAVSNAPSVDAEIVAVDSGSTDNTAELIQNWAQSGPVPVRFLAESRPGRARAINAGLRASTGDIIVFCDDDCTLHPEYVNDLLRYDAADTGLVLRGGRIELGDPADLPYTILTGNTRLQWSREMGSARHESLLGRINGCNMVMRRALIDRIGLMDEHFGPGSRIGSGDDGDYMLRAYLAGAVIEYVPDMQVFHHHGRKTKASIHALFRRYLIGGGALNAKYVLKHPNFCRMYLWDLKNALREIIRGTNTFLPEVGFSHKDKVKYATMGALLYLFWPYESGASKRWDEQRKLAPLRAT